MLAGLTTKVELLMLALDVIVEADQLVVDRCRCSTAGSNSTNSRAGMCLWTRAFLNLTIYPFSSKRNEQQLCLATYGPLVEFPRESNVNYLTRLPVFDSVVISLNARWFIFYFWQ